MSEFNVSDASLKAQIERARQRKLVRDRLFVLLLGPSAMGKSTIIRELNDGDDAEDGSGDFVYVKPIITRPNREGEVDKISVTDEEFDQIEAEGGFVYVNPLYGVRYGTPLMGILCPLAEGKTPILDFPLADVGKLQRPEYDILTVYVYPTSTDEWRSRLESCGRSVNGRLEAGLSELAMLGACGGEHPTIDISVVNAEGGADEAARTIRRAIDAIVA